MRFVGYLMVRLVAAFLIVGLILYLFIIGPRGSVNRTINHYVQANQAFDNSLQTARQRLKDLPSPSTIVPAQPGARQYANKLNDAKGAFSTSVPKPPAAIDNPSRDEHILKFNQVITDPYYHQASQRGGQSLSADYALLTHQAAVMMALANLLEYNPVKDLSSTNKTALFQNLEAAKGGLKITIDRLNSAPEYQNDKNLVAVLASVKEVQAAAAKASAAVTSANFTQQKQAFIDATHQAQKDIIANRRLFWSTESSSLFQLTDQAQKAFAKFLIKLLHV